MHSSRTRKILKELVTTFLISYIIYGVSDNNIFTIYDWDIDKVMNILQTWVLVFTSYFLYNEFLMLMFKKINKVSVRKLTFILVGISIAVLVWAMSLNILYYRLYYNVKSLREETIFYEFDLPMAFLVLVSFSFYFQQKFYNKPIDHSKSFSELPHRLVVRKGNKNVFLDMVQIGLFHISNGIVWIFSNDGDKYRSDYSLTEIIQQLDERSFFKVNRQAIVSRESVVGITKADFQKLSIELTATIGFDEKLVVPKYTAPSFKKWIADSVL